MKVYCYRSKRDAWLVSLIVMAALMCVVVSAPLVFSGNALLAMLIVLSGTVLPLWIVASTRYLVSQDSLKVISGPFRWTIGRDSITAIEPTRSPLSSPALSLDRLRIHYGAGKSLLVSPEEQRAFMAILGFRP